MREIPTGYARDPTVATSEQILIHSLPQSEAEQLPNVWPSSSAVPVAPMAHATSKRPNSARAASPRHTQVACFDQSTDRLVRNLEAAHANR